MKGAESFKPDYTTRYEVGRTIDNYSVGEVVSSKNPKYPVGAIVTGFLGLEEFTRVSADQDLEIIEGARESKLPLSYHIGALGMPVSLTLQCSVQRQSGKTRMRGIISIELTLRFLLCRDSLLMVLLSKLDNQKLERRSMCPLRQVPSVSSLDR